MMIENPTQSGIQQEQTRKIIAKKSWYGLDKETGAFNWELSLERLSEALGLESKKEAVRNVIEESFSPACLSQVEVIDPNTEEKIKRPLIEILIEEGYSITVWTEGDETWQRRKMELVGLSDLEKKDKIKVESSPANKLNTLRRILKEDNQHSVRIVVDDKRRIIDSVAAMQNGYKNLLPFHFKLKDPQADAAAFYHWLKGLRFSPNNVHLILDFDGVIADTDGVLFGPVVEKLTIAFTP